MIEILGKPYPEREASRELRLFREVIRFVFSEEEEYEPELLEKFGPKKEGRPRVPAPAIRFVFRSRNRYSKRRNYFQP